MNLKLTRTPDGQRVAVFYTKCTTGCSDHSSPPTHHPHHRSCAKPWPPST